ncbi:MAG: hypothetical protein R3B47_13905 [Bacteroidia bacterium]
MLKVVQTLLVVSLGLLVLGLQSCVKDDCTSQEIAYMSYEPVYMSEAEFKSAVQLNAPQDLVNPGKIYLYQDYLLVNELAQGVHIFDNSNPASPKALAFLATPGNYDIAVNCDKLYLDSSTDLLVFDFTNPERPVLINRIENTFPHNLYFRGYTADESKGKVVNWVMEMKIEKFDCKLPEPEFVTINRLGGVLMETAADFNAQSAANRTAQPTTSGIAGSTARFASLGSNLYVISPFELKVYDIEVCDQPNLLNSISLNLWGGEAETIFPEGNRLFIGSTNGMFIFDNSNPDFPTMIGSLQHGSGCDPVVAQDNFAYVTLRSSNSEGPCPGWTNELQIVDISNPSSPFLSNRMFMDGPQGLSVDGDVLFVCDGTSGLRVLDVSSPNNPREMARFAEIQATDVIAYNGNLIMVGEEGLAMYSYDQDFNVEALGVIPVK